MADIDDVKNEQETVKAQRQSLFRPFGSIICLLIVVTVVGYIWYKNIYKPPLQISGNVVIATVNTEELIKEHPNYAKLQKLKAEKIAILAKLQEYNFDESKIVPPKVEPAVNVFEQVLDEQANLRTIKIKQQVKEDSINQEKIFQQDMATEKEAIIKRVTDRYANAILNCTIKLDNADNLKLTDEQKNQLIDKLAELKQERDAAIAKIKQDYEFLIADKLSTWTKDYEAGLIRASQDSQQAEVADSLAKQQAENAREQKYLQDRKQMLQARKNDSERLIVLLHTKEKEMQLLRKSMIKDIADKAADIAKEQHYDLVLTGESTNLDLFGNIELDNLDNDLLSGMIVSSKSVDITEAVRQALMQDNKIEQDYKWKDDTIK